MEKLIELLNEYAHTYADHYDDTGEEIEITFTDHNDQCFSKECDGKYSTLVDDVVISKRYGFIQWLYDNDKINMDEVADRMDSWGTDNSCDVPNILMNLAIKDNPIEFLISILK